MAGALLDVKIDRHLRERLTSMAARDHRSLSGQTLHLVEVGMRALETPPEPTRGILDAGAGRAEAAG